MIKEVEDKFKYCGEINDIRFVNDSQTNKFKGFCYIDFSEHKGLIKALKLNNTFLGGRKNGCNKKYNDRRAYS